MPWLESFFFSSSLIFSLFTFYQYICISLPLPLLGRLGRGNVVFTDYEDLLLENLVWSIKGQFEEIEGEREEERREIGNTLRISVHHFDWLDMTKRDGEEYGGEWREEEKNDTNVPAEGEIDMLFGSALVT